MSALTHDFLGKALEVWRLTAPGIVVDCIEMDSVAQERALLEGRISVGILVPSDRPVLELLHVRFLVKYPVRLALPKSHPHADKPEIPISLLKEESGRRKLLSDWNPDNCIRLERHGHGIAQALQWIEKKPVFEKVPSFLKER